MSRGRQHGSGQACAVSSEAHVTHLACVLRCSSLRHRTVRRTSSEAHLGDEHLGAALEEQRAAAGAVHKVDRDAWHFKRRRRQEGGNLDGLGLARQGKSLDGSDTSKAGQKL